MIKFPEKPDIELIREDYELLNNVDQFAQWILGAVVLMNSGVAYAIFQIYTNPEQIKYDKDYIFICLILLAVGLISVTMAHFYFFMKKQFMYQERMANIHLAKKISLTEEHQEDKDEEWLSEQQEELDQLKSSAESYRKNHIMHAKRVKYMSILCMICLQMCIILILYAVFAETSDGIFMQEKTAVKTLLNTL